MRTLIKIVLSILIFIALGALVASVFFYAEVNKNYNDNKVVYSGNPDYIFSLVMSTGDTEYINKIKKGVYEVADSVNAAIEFHETNELTNSLTNADYVNIARLSGLDAIIVNGTGSDDLINAVDNAVGLGLPVIISGVNDVQCSRNMFIGTNQYEYGTKAAELAAKACENDGFINLAVIMSSESSEVYGEDQIDRRLAGLTGKMQTINNMRLITTDKTSSDIIGAEDVTQRIIREFPEVNVIFCMNSRDTIAAAQAVVDRNKVGTVKIVGTDITDEIIDFINKGIIYGVIDRNAEEIGRQSVEGIIDLLNGELHSSYINVPMRIVTAENANDYAE